MKCINTVYHLRIRGSGGKHKREGGGVNNFITLIIWEGDLKKDFGELKSTFFRSNTFLLICDLDVLSIVVPRELM